MLIQKNFQQNQIYLPFHKIVIIIQDKKGEGTQGSVYQGFIKNTNQQVAIKIASEINSREMEILYALQKQKPKHIIEIYAFEKVNSQFYVVMELAEMNVYQFISTDQYLNYDLEQKNQLFLQICEGVNEFHNLGYFHRDLKPENFVSIRNQQQNQVIVKLIDFGISKQINQNFGKQTQNLGTPYYIAPNVISSNSYSKDVDIWSLGLIWYEILTRSTFFDGNNQYQILNQISSIKQIDIDQKIDKLSQIQKDQRELMKQMVCTNESQRVDLNIIINQLKESLQQQKSKFIEAEIQSQLYKEFLEKEKNLVQQSQIQFYELQEKMKKEFQNQTESIKQQMKIEQSQKVLAKEQELRQQIQQKQQQESNLNKSEQQFLQEQEFQFKMNQFKQQFQEEYEYKMQQEINQIENQLNIKQKEDQENFKKRTQEEVQQQMQQELKKKVSEIQLRTQNQINMEEFKVKKQPYQNMLNLLKFYLQSTIQNLEIRIVKINDFKVNKNQEKELLQKLQNFLDEKKKDLLELQQEEAKFNKLTESQQFLELQKLETKYKNQFLIANQEMDMLNQATQNSLIDFQHKQNQIQTKNLYLIYDKIINYQKSQQKEINNIKIVQEKYSHFAINLKLQIEYLNRDANEIALSINQISQYFNSDELKFSNGLLRLITLQQNQILQQQDTLQKNIISLKKELEMLEDEIKQQIEFYLQESGDKVDKIEFNISNFIQKCEDNENEILIQLKNQQQIFKEIQNQLSQLIQNSLNIEQYIKIQHRFLNEEQILNNLFEQLQNSILTNSQIRNITKIKLDQISRLQQTQSEFQDSIQILKDKLGSINNECVQFNNQDILNNFEKKAHELDELKQKAKQEFEKIITQIKEGQQTEDQFKKLQNEFDNCYEKLQENKKYQYQQILDLEKFYKNLIKQNQDFKENQAQIINKEMQCLMLDFENQQQLYFTHLNIQEITYDKIKEQYKSKQQQFELLESKFQKYQKFYEENFNLFNSNSLIKPRDFFLARDFQQDSTRLLQTFLTKSSEKFQELENFRKLIQKFSERIKFQDKEIETDIDKEIAILKQWSDGQQSIFELKQSLFQLKGSIQSMQKADENKLNILSNELKVLKQKVDSLTQTIPTKETIKQFQAKYQEINKSFFTLNYQIILIKSYNLSRYYKRIKDSQNKKLNKKILYNQSQIQNQQKNVKKWDSGQNLNDDLYSKYLNCLKYNNHSVDINELKKDEQQIDEITIEIQNWIISANKVKIKNQIKDQKFDFKNFFDNYLESFELCQFRSFKEFIQKI